MGLDTSDPSTAAHTIAGEDSRTQAYFDNYVPDYSEGRLEGAAVFISGTATPEARLIDIGCGVGNTLDFLRRETGVDAVVGMDVSERCLTATRERLGCETVVGSILDPHAVEPLKGQFDFAILAAVLHHLIGRTRQGSKEHVATAIRHALELLRPGGHLVIHEPTYSPPAITAGVFWLKKAVAFLTDKRMEVTDRWLNIGPPVVSYLSNEELLCMSGEAADARIVWCQIEPSDPPALVRPLLRRSNTTVVVRRDAV